MRNLTRLTNAASTIAAWEDWNKLAATATEQGHADLVEQLRPHKHNSWRVIDKRIAQLREALTQVR